jgi:hypothetical protein
VMTKILSGNLHLSRENTVWNTKFTSLIRKSIYPMLYFVRTRLVSKQNCLIFSVKVRKIIKRNYVFSVEIRLASVCAAFISRKNTGGICCVCGLNLVEDRFDNESIAWTSFVA